MELSELLQWLSQSRKTGTLIIDNGKITKKIFFDDGVIVSSSTSDPNGYLGHFLVSHGFIDEVTLTKAMEMQEENKTLLGKILLSIGVIEEADLERMLQLKAEESIFETFMWPEGEFEFREAEVEEYSMLPIALSVTRLVIQGHQRLDEWTQIRKAIPSSETVPVTVAKLETPFEDEGVRRVFEMVNDDRTIQEICLQTHSSEFYVCRILYEQIQEGNLKVVRPRKVQIDASGSSVVTVSADILVRSAAELLEDEEFENGLRHLRAAATLEPESRSVRETVESSERHIRDKLEAAGITLSAVPVAVSDISESQSLDITPQEGFLLTRIDGKQDIKMILKITPMGQLEALVALWSLARTGHIRLG